MMATTQTSRAEGTSTRPPRRTLRRGHAINLCCAASVAPMVEEIARNLRGLGFAVTVSCGGEARAALLGKAPVTGPTIHVVCVQGSLQERVLGPLRQALTQRDQHQHLFVAVLDLSVPLTMVGHIRRFAEALERSPAAKIRVRNEVGDRRRWREVFGHREFSERPSRSYPAVTARRTTGAHAPIPVPTRRPRTISARHRAGRLVPTGRNQAITASQTLITASRTAATATRVSPVLPSRPGAAARRRAITPQPANIGAVADAIVAAHEAVKAKVAETKKRVEAAVAEDDRRDAGAPITSAHGTVSGQVDVVADVDADATVDAATDATPEHGDDLVRAKKAPTPEPAPAVSAPFAAAGLKIDATVAPVGTFADAIAPRRRVTQLDTAAAIAAVQPRPKWPWLVGVAAIAAGLAVWQPWQTQGTEAAAGHAAARADAAGSDLDDPPAASNADESPSRASASDSPTPAAVAPTDDDVATDDPAPADDDVDPEENTPEPENTGASDLTAALARREVVRVDKYLVTRQRGNETSWGDARTRCAMLEIDGVSGWRLPWRRELKLLGVAGHLHDGVFWSGSKVDGDPDSAYAWSTSARNLVVFLKQEVTGEVVCLKRDA